MAKSVESCRHELATVRTGRASPHLLDRVIVDYYGAETPIKQLAQVSATDARLLTLTPFDKSSISAIEKAIMESDLGLTPYNDGNVVRLQIPELNEERRREMVKVVHGVGEEGKVAVRNIRRDVMHDLRELKKEGEVGEDDERRAEAELQKRTDDATKEIDEPAEGQGRRDPRGVSRSADGTELRRDHHRRQRALGSRARAAGDRGPRGGRRRRSRRGCATPPSSGSRSSPCTRSRPRTGSRPQEEVDGPDGDVRRAHRPRDAGARRRGRADALHRPARGRRRASSSS